MNLEQRYRWWLSVLPAWYRAHHEDEMVAVYLAARHGAGRTTRVEVGEVVATLRLAAMIRMRLVGAPSRATLWFIALAAVTLLGTRAVVGLALGVSSQVSTTTSTWVMNPDGTLVQDQWSPGLGPEWPVVSGLLWLVALALLVGGLRRGALALAVLPAWLDVSTALGPLLASTTMSHAYLPRPDLGAALLPLLSIAALVAAGRAPGETPGWRSRLAVPVATATLLGLGWWAARHQWPVPVDDGSNWPVAVLAVVAGASAVLAAHRRLPPCWPAAVLTLALLAVLVGPLPRARPVVWSPPGEMLGAPDLVPGLVLGLVAVVLAALAWVLSCDRHPVPGPEPLALRESAGQRLGRG